MVERRKVLGVLLGSLAVAGLMVLTSSKAAAHCDTLDGPVVKEAKTALDKGDVTPLLKCVKKDNEEELKAAFKKTEMVRNVLDKLAGVLIQIIKIYREAGADYITVREMGADLLLETFEGIMKLGGC